MPDPKKKKASTTPDKKNAALVQVGAGMGASRYVRKDSPAGKQAAAAKKAMERKKAGKRLLRSEQKLISKYFNPTKVKKKTPKYKKKSG